MFNCTAISIIIHIVLFSVKLNDRTSGTVGIDGSGVGGAIVDVDGAAVDDVGATVVEVDGASVVGSGVVVVDVSGAWVVEGSVVDV